MGEMKCHISRVVGMVGAWEFEYGVLWVVGITGIIVEMVWILLEYLVMLLQLPHHHVFGEVGAGEV